MDRVVNCKPSYTKNYDPSHYRVVFFSGAPIGVPFLEKLYEDKRFEVVGVVTMPDMARDRGQKVQENVVKSATKELIKNTKIENIDFESFIMTPTKLNPETSEEGKEFCEWLKSLNADFFVTIAYGKIVPQAVLDIPKFAPINVHGSLLPKYRGASPIQSVFLQNEKETGLTIMKMVKAMDAGPMIDILRMKIGFDWTAKTIIDEFMSK
jgi:methionyl-tRNA formyltransferase